MRHALAIALAALTVALVGCSERRALSVIRESGDKAYRFDNYDLARAEYAEVVERDPTDWEYRAKYGRTLLELGQAVAAREQLAIAFERKPDCRGLVDPKRIELCRQVLDLYARAMLESGSYEMLHETLLARARETQAVEDYLLLGLYNLRAGDADSAERALITAARLDQGQTPDPQLALATFYETVGDETQALRRLRMALFTDLENAEAIERIRAKGHIPGPTFALPPLELTQP